MSLSRKLDDAQLRVLGALIEKAKTTPEQYPLTLNALKSACNQKSNRHPVMALETGEVSRALRELEGLRLAGEPQIALGRVAKYEHYADRVLGVSPSELAVLCVLILRGPQTPGEIRGRSARLFSFIDTADVERSIARLREREDGPLVVELGRGPGQKESRWFHTLGESVPEPEQAAPRPPATAGASADLVEELSERVSELERRLQALEERFDGG